MAGPSASSNSAQPTLGANGQQARKLSPEASARLNTKSKQLSAAFGQIIAIMMRAKRHQYTFLSDLEWMVLPAITTGQFAIAEQRHKDSGLTSPRAAILWASVSDEVDQRLSANRSGAIRLKPSEWSSGTNAWLVDAVGDARAIKVLVDQVLSGTLKARALKAIVRGPDGKPTVQIMRTPEGRPAMSTAKS